MKYLLLLSTKDMQSNLIGVVYYSSSPTLSLTKRKKARETSYLCLTWPPLFTLTFICSLKIKKL